MLITTRNAFLLTYFLIACISFFQQGLLHEMRAEFPASEVVYRSVLQITSGHSTALERLGRVYLRLANFLRLWLYCKFIPNLELSYAIIV